MNKNDITVTMTLAEFEELEKKCESVDEVRKKSVIEFCRTRHVGCNIPGIEGEMEVDIDLDKMIEFIKKDSGIKKVRLIHNKR